MLKRSFAPLLLKFKIIQKNIKSPIYALGNFCHLPELSFLEMHIKLSFLVNLEIEIEFYCSISTVNCLVYTGCPNIHRHVVGRIQDRLCQEVAVQTYIEIIL